MTKHSMFRTKTYASPENFTQPLEVMEVTFRRSGGGNVTNRATKSSFCVARANGLGIVQQYIYLFIYQSTSE